MGCSLFENERRVLSYPGPLGLRGPLGPVGPLGPLGLGLGTWKCHVTDVAKLSTPRSPEASETLKPKLTGRQCKTKENNTKVKITLVAIRKAHAQPFNSDLEAMHYWSHTHTHQIMKKARRLRWYP